MKNNDEGKRLEGAEDEETGGAGPDFLSGGGLEPGSDLAFDIHISLRLGLHV